MDNKTRELIKLAVARLKDCKASLAECVDESDRIGDAEGVVPVVEEQFAEDGAGGEALAILEGLLKDQ